MPYHDFCLTRQGMLIAFAGHARSIIERRLIFFTVDDIRYRDLRAAAARERGEFDDGRRQQRDSGQALRLLAGAFVTPR